MSGRFAISVLFSRHKWDHGAPSRLLYTVCRLLSCHTHRPRLATQLYRSLRACRHWGNGLVLLVGARGYARPGDTPDVCACCACCACLAVADNGRPPIFGEEGCFFEGRCTSLDSTFLHEPSAWGYTRSVQTSTTIPLAQKPSPNSNHEASP